MDEIKNICILVYNSFAILLASLLTSFPFDASLVLVIVMFFDIITGIASSYKDDKYQLTTRKFKIGIMGKALMLLIPVLIFLVIQVVFDTDMIMYVKMVINFLIIGEAYSVISNINNFKTGKKLPEIDVLSIIINKIKKEVKDYLKNNFED